MIRTTVVGSYPKVDGAQGDNLPGTIDRWQRRLVDDQGLEQETQRVIRRVLAEQEQAGLDLLTDGQIRWEDLPHALARDVKGIRRGSLRRFFDNNVYYRRLEVEGTPQWRKGSAAEEVRFAAQNAAKPVKAILPGPLTLVVSTELKAGQTREGMLGLYTDLLRREVEALEKAGAKEIQLEEPALAPGEPLLEKGIEAINRIFNGGGVKARRWVVCYFHDLSSILPSLAKLQVEVLGLDLVAGPRVADLLREGLWKGEVALGLVDARNTKLESVDELVRQLQAVAKAVPIERLWLTPNCGLEFLPHGSALKKLQLLREAAKRL